VPYHSGTPAVSMGRGPTALIEEHGLADALGPDVGVEVVDPPDPGLPQIGRVFDLAATLAERARSARAAGRLPFVVAGNCNSCLGTVAGLEREPLGVVWFDAHADFDTPEDNRSGFLDVMALSTLTGACWEALRHTIPGFHEVAEANVLMVGVRDLEPYQRARLDGSRVRSLYGDLIRSAPIEDVLVPALDDLRDRTPAIYLHVDLDVLDPSEGRANEYAAPGGLSLDELERALRLIGSRFAIEAAALTAYDPGCDQDAKMAKAALRVARVIREVA
jgi:arginase